LFRGSGINYYLLIKEVLNMGKEMVIKNGDIMGRLAVLPSHAAAAMKVGVVAGGTISAIQNTYDVTRGKITYNKAVSNVAKDTVGAGIATVAGSVTMTVLGIGGILGLVGFVGVTVASKGFWDSIVYNSKPVEQDS
jgi:hypothetical protein